MSPYKVADVAASRAFYEVLLAPLGLHAAYTDGAAVGFTSGAVAPFWLSPATRDERRELHLAFRAAGRAAVHSFHQSAISIDAELLHAPRLFPDYHANYFACFVRDPDGHNAEAVCHQSASAPGAA